MIRTLRRSSTAGGAIRYEVINFGGFTSAQIQAQLANGYFATNGEIIAGTTTVTFVGTATVSNAQLADSLNQRFSGATSDTLTGQMNYKDYIDQGTGNGRRVLIVPIIGDCGAATKTISAFGAIFLRTTVPRSGGGAGNISANIIPNFVIPNAKTDPNAAPITTLNDSAAVQVVAAQLYK